MKSGRGKSTTKAEERQGRDPNEANEGSDGVRRSKRSIAWHSIAGQSRTEQNRAGHGEARQGTVKPKQSKRRRSGS